MQCFNYYCGTPPNCDTTVTCDLDGIHWNNVTVILGADAVAGTYGVTLHPPFSNAQSVNIAVTSNQSYSLDLGPNGGLYWGGAAVNMVGGSWSTDAPLGGSAITVDADSVSMGPNQCGSAVDRSGAIVVTIGTAPTPTPTPTPTPSPLPSPTSDKPNDETAGGNGKDGGHDNSTSNTGGDDDGCSHGMARYTADLFSASLRITDTPLEYSPPAGPKIDFIVAYHQRDADQSTQQYSNLGPNWTFNWMSYVTDDPNNVAANVAIYVREGGTELYSGFNASTQSFASDVQTHATLVRTGGTTYEKDFPDGSKQIFGPATSGATSYPRLVFLTQLVDSFGNTVNIHYDSNHRIDTITDALGQVTTLAYEMLSDSNKITKVTDPFGRYVTLAYNASGQLQSTTDPVGISSIFGYQSGTNFINSLTTPYGTATFTTGESGTNKWLNMTDPSGASERVEYKDNATGIGATEASANVPTGFSGANNALDVRNSFYWDKKALSLYPPVNGVYDYTKAKVTHWLLSSDGSSPVAIAGSEKLPLENRVWYQYKDQPDSFRVGVLARVTQSARVLDDGTTQLYQSDYNSLGNVTKTTDPVGRVFTYVYASNGIDLLERRQTRGTNNELVESYNNYTQHLPQTATDAAGKTTTTTYTTRGQVQTVQNAKGEITSYSYGGAVPDGYLASVTSPLFNGSSAVTSYTYDSAHRIRTVTDADSYVITTDYDNLDRPTKITYPDGTYKQMKYTEYTDHDTGVMTLDLTQSRDRRGLWTYKHYNSNKQLEKITDPLGRVTQYGWCACGSLTTITDPLQRVTTFNRDLQSRITSKVFHTNTGTIAYVYENTTSRLKTVTDGKNQTANYTYFSDNDLKQVSYTNAQIATPTVSYTYDPNYDRVATMTDGTGVTSYAYYPITATPPLGAGKLQTVDGPLANDTISYTYDELGRELSQSVNGVSASQTYDSLGRVGSITNALGSFTNTYVGVTPRLQSRSIPNGQSVNLTYFPNLQDKRLQTILNKTATSTVISKFDYEYDLEGQIKNLTKQLGAAGFPETWSPTSPNSSMQDAADQFTNITVHPSADVYANTSWGYDAAGNRNDHTFNSLNQISDSGYTYDNNGNLTADPNRTYEWDAANRLTAINYTGIGSRTEFTYDGLGRRVKIVEKDFPLALDVQIQPPNKQYTQYGPFTFTTASTANYTLTLQGLNPNGGDNVALMDTVQLNSANLTNGGFETPSLSAGTYQYRPTAATWTFIGNSGVTRTNTIMSPSTQPTPPGNNQVGFLQDTGSVAQTFSVPSGSNNIKVKAAQRATNNPTFQVIHLTLQSTTLSLVSTKQFIWIGNSIAEERDASNTVTRRFYPQGEQIAGANYFYLCDHLGSLTELTDTTGAVRAEYYYDQWGNSTKRSGDMDASFGFTRQYFHAKSGLNLALYRAYDSRTARWISRDPSGEEGGLNLYAYVGNNPINAVDPKGLCPGDWLDLLNQFMLGAEEGAYAAIDGAIPFWDPFSDRYSTDHDGIKFSEMAGGFGIWGVATGGAGELVTALRGASASGLGDLTVSEVRAIQAVVNEAGRPLEVVGSAARAARQAGSDIDYIASPSSYQYFEGLETKLPSINPNHGIIPGLGNPNIGPVIQFVPKG